LRDDNGVLLAGCEWWAVIYADLLKSVGPMRVDPTVSNVEREYMIGCEQHTRNRRTHCHGHPLIRSDAVKGPVAGIQNIPQSLFAVERRSRPSQLSNHKGACNITARMSAETVRNCNHQWAGNREDESLGRLGLCGT
jgi:hypothetical protein